MEQARLIRPGDAAKNFSLKDQRDKTVDLFEMAGKRVILSFHPLAWTNYCAAQMTSLEDNRERFERMNTVAVGISVDSLPPASGRGQKPSASPQRRFSVISGLMGR